MALIVVAFLVLSGAIPGLPGMTGRNATNLTMWGSLPNSVLSGSIDAFNAENQGSFSLKYSVFNEETYEEELVDALASATGPDMWVTSQDLILKHKNKSALISLGTFSERDFRDTFVDVAEIFLWTPNEDVQGMLAIPFAVDPIVMYWNKDMFNNANLVNPPSTWEEFMNYVKTFTIVDSVGNILQSGTAMGEFSNIENAKDIISLLILQSGNKIVERNSSRNGKDYLDITFGEKGNLVVEPVSSALNFFIAFSNPAKVSYSWHRGLPNSKEMFTSGKLAMYFGYASELDDIQSKNPHLNFDVATVPQSSASANQIAFGKVYGVAVSKTSPNTNKAGGASFEFAKNSSALTPVRRDILAQGTSDPIQTIFYKSAVQARSWLEPDSKQVDNIYSNMVSAITTGKKYISDAVRDAQKLLEIELGKVN